MDIEQMEMQKRLSPLYVAVLCLSGLLVGLLTFCVGLPAACIFWTWTGLRRTASAIRNSWRGFNSGGLRSFELQRKRYGRSE